MGNTRNINFDIRTFIVAVMVVLILGFSSQPGLAFNEVSYVREIAEHLNEPIDSVVSDGGDVYVLDKNLSKVFVFDSKGQLKSSFGEKGSSPGQLYKPTSIALNQQGEVIVVDAGNTRINVYNAKGYFQYQLGNRGRAKGEFEKPISVAVSQSDFIYVADEHLNKIAQYSPKGVFLNEIMLDYTPLDITFNRQDHLYVLSSELGSIRKYKDQTLTREIILTHNDTNLLKDATGISVDDNNDIYLITGHDNSIYKFNQSEEFLYSFGSKGEGRGQFRRPSGIFHKDGYVYVPDTKNHRLQIFEVQRELDNNKTSEIFVNQEAPVEYRESIYVSKFISDLNVFAEGKFYALSDYKGCVFKNAGERKVLGLNVDNVSALSKPQAFELKASGELLIADTQNHSVQFLNPDGSYGYRFGRKGKNQSQFNHLEGIAIHKDGYIYIADTHNDRIQIFNSDGIYLYSFGEKAVIGDDGNPVPGTFQQPKSLEFDSHGNLFVLDYRNKRIQIFDHKGNFIDQVMVQGRENQFKDPVDIAIDEKDYLYVADRGDHSIKIFDPDHKFVCKFGSQGKGPSYFPSLSALDSINNAIYVADYDVDNVRVFSFNLGKSKEMAKQRKQADQEQEAAVDDQKSETFENLEKISGLEEEIVADSQEQKIAQSHEAGTDKFFLSRITYALGYINLPHEAKLKMLRKDLERNGVVPSEILDQMVIESEDEIADGRVRIVISVPKN